MITMGDAGLLQQNKFYLCSLPACITHTGLNHSDFNHCFSR